MLINKLVFALYLPNSIVFIRAFVKKRDRAISERWVYAATGIIAIIFVFGGPELFFISGAKYYIIFAVYLDKKPY